MDKFLYMGRKITEMLMLEKRLQPGQEPGARWPAKVSQYLEKDSWWCAVFHIPIHLLEKKPVDLMGLKRHLAPQPSPTSKHLFGVVYQHYQQLFSS